MSILSSILPILVIVVGVAVGIGALISIMYKKAPPSQAMVITGPFGNKTVIGKGVFIIPFIQRVDRLSLENIQVDFTSRDEIPTQDAINIKVDAVANVAISQDPELLKRAASKFLGQSLSSIRDQVTPVLEGNIREIISQMTLKEVIQGDKKTLADNITANVTPNLADMGLELTTFNIQNFKDSNGIIDNLGIENTVQISKDAAKAKAAAEAEIAIAKAKAKQEANEADVAAETEIAQKKNELAIKKAELKRESDIKIAEAEAAKGIRAEEKRQEQEVATANANLARQEKEIELKAREVEITEKSLEAEIKKKAEAEKYAAQQAADAKLYATQKDSEAELFERAKKAEAEQIEAEREAAAKKALAEAIKAQGEAEAAATKAKGEAEAAAIQAKLEAEAEGLMKKAEAMKNYQDAAVMDLQLSALQTYFEQLPAIAEAVAKPLTQVDKIVMYGDGNTAKLTGDIMKTVNQVSDGLSESMGIDLKTVLSSFLGSSFSKKNVDISISDGQDA